TNRNYRSRHRRNESLRALRQLPLGFFSLQRWIQWCCLLSSPDYILTSSRHSHVAPVEMTLFAKAIERIRRGS
ncbi:MAG TPA: hypothetical protein VFE22_16165, partial [Edaphobacter sp.]|nr:hypothetical protein [Edaphobacter sp.]